MENRRAALGGEFLLVVTAAGDVDLAGGRGQIGAGVLGGLGDEVEEAAHLARTHDRVRRAPHHLHFGSVADGGGIGAAVLDPLEALEVVFSQGAAHVQRARHAVEAGRVAGGGDLHQFVDAGDAVAIQRGVADEGGRAGRLQKRFIEAEDRARRLLLDQPDLVGGDHHLLDRFVRRRRGGRSRRSFSRCGACSAHDGAERQTRNP